MHVSHHLFLFRAGLFTALLVPSLNCVQGEEVPEACGCEGCGDLGPDVLGEDVTPDDDDSAEVALDDDDADDDDAVEEVDLTAGLPVCQDSIVEELGRIASAAPGDGSGRYLAESEDLREMIGASFADLLSGAPMVAAADAALVDYHLCRGEGDEGGLALWRPVDRGTGGARVVFRGVAAAPLVIGVPHGVSSPDTLAAGLDLFLQARARLLVVGATHECATEVASPCAGTTTACSSEERAPAISDMARWDESVFHIAHAFFASENPDWVLTIDALDDDGVTVSDGTAAVASSGAVRAISSAIAVALPDEDATACNPGLALPEEARVCGLDNVQGRLLNLPP